jgi:hypothetical protein
MPVDHDWRSLREDVKILENNKMLRTQTEELILGYEERSIMPYIKAQDRIWFNPGIEALQTELTKVPIDKRKGALNYVISRIASGVFPHDYHGISNIVGALRDAASEIDRRLMGPREDQAILNNGDLPEFE